MGNICRSPSAEGIFIQQLKQSAFKNRILTDSAGTHGYHIGHPPDKRAIATAARFGVDIGQLCSRKIKLADFDEFDLIIAMDEDNLSNLRNMQPANSRARVQLMLAYLPGEPGQDGQTVKPSQIAEVPDPYYGDVGDFEYMYSLLEPASAALLKSIEARLGGLISGGDQPHRSE